MSAVCTALVVSAPRSLGFFPCPDSSVHLCSPALALAHLDPFRVLPCLSMRASGGKCIAHLDSFRVLTRPSICALQPSPSPTWILSASCLVCLCVLQEVSASLTQILSTS